MITLTLIATNTFIQQSIEKQLVIENKNFKNKPIKYLQERNTVEEKPFANTVINSQTVENSPNFQKNKKSALVTIPKKEKVTKNNANDVTNRVEPNNKTLIFAYITITIMVVLALIMAYYVYNLNALKS